MSHIWMSHVTHMNESCHAYEWVCNVWMSHFIDGWVVSYMDESCRIWMSHATNGWLMQTSHVTHTDESYNMRMSHISYGWVMSHMDESCHKWTSHVINGWVMPHLWIKLVTYESATWHMWRSHALSRLNEPSHIWRDHFAYERLMAHMKDTRKWVISVTYATGSGIGDGSSSDRGSILSLTWISRVTKKTSHVSLMDESCHMRMNNFTYKWVISHTNECLKDAWSSYVCKCKWVHICM